MSTLQLLENQYSFNEGFMISWYIIWLG